MGKKEAAYEVKGRQCSKFIRKMKIIKNKCFNFFKMMNIAQFE